jgi:membrane dipeptidase
MAIDRREFLKLSSALAAGVVLARTARASTKVSTVGAFPGSATIIDGNLVPPFNDAGGALDEATAKAVLSSGLTALKATIGGSGNDFVQTSSEMDDYDKGIRANPHIYMRVSEPADFLQAKRSGKVGIIYSFEGVEMLEGKIERIDLFRARGVRVMQLSYNKPSPFASGVLSPQPSEGLTPLGREAVQRMNALGVSLDLSHCDELSTLAALAASETPALITHAGCSAVFANPRNKSDAVLRAMAAKGGVVGIYDLSFLARAPKQPTLDDYLRHITHALNVCGEDHVGIGSDAMLMPFDTSPANMVEWNKIIVARKASGLGAPGEGPPPFVVGLNRPDRYRIIAQGLTKRGYTPRIVDKVLGLNFQRAFTDTWKAA